MTVKELIKVLSAFNGDEEITVIAATDLQGGVRCKIADADEIYKDDDSGVIICADEY